MTMIVFDGTHFWADGKSTFRNPELADMNRGQYNKLILLDKPMYISDDSVLTVAAGTGDTRDSELVIKELNRASNNGETLYHFRSRMHEMVGDKMDCWVVGAGVRTKRDGTKEAIPTTVFNSDKWTGSRFGYSRRDKNGYCMAGDSANLPMCYDVDWVKSGADIIALASLINPHGVGGQISRYNPVTGKLDHPKPLCETRQRALYKKWEQYKLKMVAQVLDKTKANLEIRFAKAEEKK